MWTAKASLSPLEKLVVIVTGANQGLGRGLVTQALKRYTASSGEKDIDGTTSPSKVVVYLAARNPEKGTAAIQEIQKELSWSSQPQQQDDKAEDEPRMVALKFLPLDVSVDESVAKAAAIVKQQEGWTNTDDTKDDTTATTRIVMIHNAAARITPGKKQEQVVQFLDTNNYGTHRVMKHFGPVVRQYSQQHPTFVIVASSFGSLSRLPPKLQDRFQSVSNLTDLECFLAEYSQQVQDGTDTTRGEWPDWINIPSKIFQVAAMRILATEWKQSSSINSNNTVGNEEPFVVAVCPGLVQTEASRPFFDPVAFAEAPTPQEAAKPIIDLALSPSPTPSFYGKLVQKGKVIEWI